MSTSRPNRELRVSQQELTAAASSPQELPKDEGQDTAVAVVVHFDGGDHEVLDVLLPAFAVRGNFQP